MSDSSTKMTFASANWRGKSAILVLLAVGGLSAGWAATSSIHSLLFVNSPPKLLVQPNELDLGQVRPGHSLAGTVMLKNIGGGGLQIDQVHAGCACSHFQLDEKELAPGQEVRLVVTAEIRKEGQHLVFPVRINSNDPNTPEVVVLVRADAAPPHIGTEP